MYSKFTISIRKIIAVALVVFTFFVSIGTAYAYTLLGGYWASVNPLYYRIHPELSTIDKSAYSASKTSWNALGTRVFLVGKSTGYKINLYAVNSSGYNWDGLTYISPCSSCAPYTISTTYLNGYFTDTYTSGKRRSVAAHEIGHALGLGHDFGAVLMNPYTCGDESRFCTYRIYTPQADEEYGFDALYP